MEEYQESATHPATVPTFISTPSHAFSPENEDTSRAPSSTHSAVEVNFPLQHRRSTSWQPQALDSSLSASSRRPDLSSLSCPASPSPSSLSRSSSSYSSASSSRRPPLPSPPVNSPRFVPFRPPPPPPPSLTSQESAYEEKREMARLRGLDDLLEHEAESDEECDSVSPTLSDLPAYEGRQDPNERSPGEGMGKAALQREEIEVDAAERLEQERRNEEVEEVRRRVREESARIVEEDNRSGKERLMAQRRYEEEEARRRFETRLQVETGKRMEAAEAEQESLDSPPPPISPNVHDLLPLHDTKDPYRSSSGTLALEPQSHHARRESDSRAFSRRPALPGPPPVTTYSTTIPNNSLSLPPTRVQESFLSPSSTASKPHLGSSITGPSFYASSLSPHVEVERASSVKLGPSVARTHSERQHSMGPASSFYSAAVGLTLDQLQIDDSQRRDLHHAASTHSSSSVPPRSPSFHSDTSGASLHRQPSLVNKYAERHPSNRFASVPSLPLPQNPSPDFRPARQEALPPNSSPERIFQPVSSPPVHPSSTSHSQQPAFYHEIGGQLLPFYPTSTSNPYGPQAFYSPASARMQYSVSPSPPPPRVGYQSLSPPPSIQPLAFPTTTSTGTSSQSIYRQATSMSPPPSSFQVPRQRANRMSTIKNLFGRRGGEVSGAKVQVDPQTGQDWSV